MMSISNNPSLCSIEQRHDGKDVRALKAHGILFLALRIIYRFTIFLFNSHGSHSQVLEHDGWLSGNRKLCGTTFLIRSSFVSGHYLNLAII
jgi:hypothetical protein